MSTLDLGKVKHLWRGAWNSSSNYVVNDVVALNSAVWICTQTHNSGTGNEFAPGKRDRLSAYGRTLDPDEIIVYNVTVQTFGGNNFFYIDGVRVPALTLFPNVRYRFIQRDFSNLAHRIAFSTTADGIFNGGTEYTTGITFTGTPGIDGAVDVILNSNAPATLFYYSAQDINYGAGTNARITRGNSWRGWQYWDQVSSGFSFKNSWSSATQYYSNDIVEYQGATYLALADNLNKQPSSPGNNHFWLVMAFGDRRSEHNSVAQFMNKGPIDWPYPHGNNGYPNADGNLKFISRSGRLYNHGPGSTFGHGLQNNNASQVTGHPQELVFNNFEWWNSRDNGGPGRMVTPDGMPPKVIQVEQGFGYGYALLNNGEVWSWGDNTQGALGTGNVTNYGVPQRVIGLAETRIVKISSGYGVRSTTRHVLALDEYGYVWAWGANDAGQCGQGQNQSGGTPQSINRPERIPRSYFGGERAVDILAMGATNGFSYVRTSSDNIYSFGYNGAGQLGDGTTGAGTGSANKFRPVRMINWDPINNNGIRKWQAVNVGNNAAFMILDGFGFIWGTGDDTFGNLCQTTATSRTQLTKTTATPGGQIIDFWGLWADDNFGNKLTFLRHSNGTTFYAGLGSNTSFVTGNNTQVSSQITPALIPSIANITNVREVYLEGSITATQLRTIHFLLDNGRVLAQGYNTFGAIGNPEKGTTNNPTDETSNTSYPLTTYLPPGTRVRQIILGGSQRTDASFIHGVFYLTDTGQIFGHGLNRNTSGSRDQNFQAFIQWGQGPTEGSAMTMPVSLTYAR